MTLPSRDRARFENQLSPSFSLYLRVGELWAPGCGRNPCSEEQGEEERQKILSACNHNHSQSFLSLLAPVVPLKGISCQRLEEKDLWSRESLAWKKSKIFKNEENSGRKLWFDEVSIEGMWHYWVFMIFRGILLGIFTCIISLNLTKLPDYYSHFRYEETEVKGE